jgi:hypothetical protein
VKNIWFSVISICLLMGFTVNVSAVTGFSEVNNELFDKAHLKNITEPTILHYKYMRTSFVDGPREDTIDVVVSNIRNTGRKDTHFEFFTGKNKRPYLDRENQQGNSVFVFFLEYDVHELKRLTGGDWRYFQRKIRWALAQGADKKEIEIDYEGKKVKAVQHIIQPFINDPKNSRYPLYASKYYIFTLSEAIPGEIYQIRTVVPDGKTWQEGDAILTEETVTFSGFDNL